MIKEANKLADKHLSEETINWKAFAVALAVTFAIFVFIFSSMFAWIVRLNSIFKKYIRFLYLYFINYLFNTSNIYI